MRIAINTGGGDAPGLNAVIRAVVLSSLSRGWEVLGIRHGYDGLLSDDPEGVVPLGENEVRGITHRGGTILGTTNRGNPFEQKITHPDGSIEVVDRGAKVVRRLEELGVECVIAVGGDGSLRIASELARRGVNIIGVPKTIDNDLAATQVTFGFQTAVQTASDAIGRLHSTAESHNRVMVVELMGRDAGWIALMAGLSATADVILIPEIPYDLDAVCEKVEERYDGENGFAIVVAAEGAFPKGGVPMYKEASKAKGNPQYGGIAEKLARQITEKTGRETRALVVGHLQRGGEPVAFDKSLALRFGAAAVELVAQKQYGCMVALDPPVVKGVPLEEAIQKQKFVPVHGDIVNTARALGISFGD